MDLKNIDKKIISLIPIALIFLFLYISTNYITSSFPTQVVKDNLIWITPIFFGLILAIILGSFVWSFKHLKKIFPFDKKVWIVLILIFLLAFSLRAFVAPHTHRLFYDEDIYLNIAQNIQNEGRTILCNYGTPDKCIEGIYNKQPNGYPFLMSILFFVFGVSETLARYSTILFSSLIAPFVFLISYLLFKNKKISLFSSLIFSLIPISIRWAPTTTTGSVSVLFSCVTIFAFLSYLKKKKFPLLLFSFSSLAYAIQIRPESVLLIPIVGLLFLLFDKKIFSRLSNKKFLVVLIIFSLLVVPHLVHLNSVKGQSWGAKGSKLSLKYFDRNFKDNAAFFFKNERFPIVFTIFSLLGLYPFRKYWKRKGFLIAWFFTFFILYLLFYAGGFKFGVDVRYSVSLYPAIAILGGCGAFLISKTLNKFIKRQKISLLIPTIIILLAFSQFIPLASSIGPKASGARLAHDFIVEKSGELPQDCWVFTHVPSVVLVNGRNSLQAWFAQDSKVVNKLSSQSDCLLFYEEYWCNSDPWKSGPCQYFHDNFNLTVYDSTSLGNRNFTLYYMNR